MDANILNGPEDNSGIPYQSAGKSLLNVLSSHGKNHLALIDVKSGDSHTYANLVEVSQNLASNLRDFGIEKNDVIGIVAENSHKYCVALLAGLYLATPVHLINPGSTEYELKHLLNLSKPKFVFCSEKCLNNLLKAKNDLDFIQKIVLFDGNEESEDLLLYQNLIKESTRSFHVEEDIDIKTQTAIICNSSGTTGMPKGVMLSHENLRFHLVSSWNISLYMKPTECIQLVLPLFHLYALQILNAAFYSGSTLLILDHFDPKIFLEIIENYKVEQLFLVPPLINFLINSSLTEHHNLSTVKHIHNSAASLLEEDSKILKTKFNLKALHQLYGLTETTGVVIHTLGNEPYPMGSCGKLVATCQLKIVDVKTREKMGANANGEICIKTSRNMKGYINDTEKTNAAFDSEGFLRTGDIGHYDEEGFIFIVGRIKDLINYKGHKVSPIEIENILLKHPSVKDAAVVGKSDRRAGETAVGFIVKKEGTAVSEQEIFDYLSKFVGVEKRLHGGIHFVDVIPKSVNGKILRKELQKMFE